MTLAAVAYAHVMSDLVARVHALPDDVLFPAAMDVDRTGVVPDSHWQCLADEGLYGLAAPPERGGPEGVGFPELLEVLETMAGGCLATTFTWIQHHGVVRTLSDTANETLRDELLADAVAGRVRAGVAFAGVVPDPPRMRATRVEDGWMLTGDGPFVSGWGIIHVLQISAGDVETGDVIAGIAVAKEQPGITSVERLTLVAADATNTVSLRLDDFFLPDDRVVSRVPRADFLANQILGARFNGTVPLGVVRRCVRLLDSAGRGEAAARLQAECDAVRGRLDAGLADLPLMVAARADAAQLAVRAASTLVAAGGGDSLVSSNHAQLLAREAIFTLVAASRAELKRELLDRYSRS
jgi:alkylation response protein AidB-like acyl-CoA dehydrogenase